MTRTRLLPKLVAAALALSALTPTASSAATNSHGSWTFASSPVRPPSLSVSVHQGGLASGYLFTGPIANASIKGPFLGQHGPLILDSYGNAVWVHPLPHPLVAMNFQPSVYQGQPVLTWWQGSITTQGFGDGVEVIVDSHYKTVATVRAGKGYFTDFHEFLLTNRNTAYMTATRIVPANLSRYGGSKRGQVLDGLIEEVDIRTGHVLWRWDAMRHISLGDSYQSPPSSGAWDAYHLNAIDLDQNGNPLITLRNTWGVYAISRRTGRIVYTVGGKHSSLKLEPGAHFAWEHDARFQAAGQITMFDDEAAPEVAKQSRAIVLRLDLVHHAAHLVRQFLHASPPLLAGSQGNTQLLANGDTLVGWGQLPYITEYGPSGALLFDAHFHGPDESYRTVKGDWVGRPSSLPAIAVSGSPGSRTVFASWNGETGIAAWRLLGGSNPNSLTPLTGPVSSGGFETAIGTPSSDPYLAVQALDGSGAVLGTSPVKQP